MPTERLSMRWIRQVLQLHCGAHASSRVIAREVGVGRTTQDYLTRASAAELGWPLPPDQGTTLAIPHGAQILPVEAVRDWLAAAGITDGPVFRRVRCSGQLGEQALTAHAVAVLVKGRALKAGLDPSLVSGHSLRSGYVTSCCEHGVAPMLIAEQTRHKSLDMLLVYSRRPDRYKNHSGRAFL